MYHVLLADDEPWIIEGLKASIDWQKEGFSVDYIACNGLEAAKIILEEAPDLALIDIRMPGMNGLEVIEYSNALRTGTHVIIISGYAEFEYARKGIELKVDGYLIKPFTEELLLEQVRKVKAALDAAAAAQANQPEQLLLEDMEADTGYLASLYPNGCHIYLQFGGQITDLPGAALRLRLHLQHYLLVSPNPLNLSEEMLSPDILAVSCAAYYGGSLSNRLMQVYALPFRTPDHPENRLFFVSEAQPLLTASASADHPDGALSAWIQAHFRKDISFIDLCSHFSMSSTAIRSRLAQEVGMNFSQYLTQLRMNRAVELLRTSMSINDIAGECGYEDPLYFRKVFKRYYQQTPSQYRAQLEADNSLPPPRKIFKP